MAYTTRRSHQATADFWPGYVDALGTLLLIMIFLLLIFMAGRLFLTEALETTATQLSQSQTELSTREQELSQVSGERDKLQTTVTETEARAQTAETEATRLGTELATATESKAALEQQLAVLRTDLDAAKTQRDNANAEVERLSALVASLEDNAAAAAVEIDGLRASLEAEISTGEDQKQEIARLLALIEAAEKDKALAGNEIDTLKATVANEQQALSDAQAQINKFVEQIDALRLQLSEKDGALATAKTAEEEQAVIIAGLKSELEQAKASEAQALVQYRSDFFAQLIEALGQREDIEVVGDRFILQSEVLFDSGSAEINPAGRENLAKIAEVMNEISASIPGEINWILRVDGHSDKVPIQTAEFPSNWHLSSARAISVVTFLIQKGVDPKRLVAAGFGEYQPLDTGESAAALRRNRRIEFKLTNR